MATTTPNLNLVKPDLTDFADIRVLNRNMDILDENVQRALDRLTVVDSWYTEDTNGEGPLYWVKYGDGRLEQGILLVNNLEIASNIMMPVTFPTPFIDARYSVTTTLYGDRENPGDPSMLNNKIDMPSYVQKEGKTTTGCYVSRCGINLGLYVVCSGRWK